MPISARIKIEENNAVSQIFSIEIGEIAVANIVDRGRDVAVGGLRSDCIVDKWRERVARIIYLELGAKEFADR
ncbi:MAG: hypothetical protein QNK24_00335 [Desulfuromusa sp.]|nr:hypothetical protein [Desulfuromusa sp.]